MKKQTIYNYMFNADAELIAIIDGMLSANLEMQKEIARAIKGKPINKAKEIIKGILTRAEPSAEDPGRTQGRA